ncbi:MAG TPA: hypothetical protein VFQ41_01660 [Candidatus Angelobacter sp.]|nr:hypothetical protein [Candidatus Angelobacter sp.]
MKGKNKPVPKLIVFLLGAFVCLAVQGFAQTCAAAPGEKVLKINLQNSPNSMEPSAEPARIRVDDRTTVHLCLANISPVDVCSLSGRTPAPTAETNPIESLVSTINTLGGFAIPFRSLSTEDTQQFSSMLSEKVSELEGRTEGQRRAAPRPVLDDPEYKKFIDAAALIEQARANLLAEQMETQGRFDTDTTRLLNYVSADYRGLRWTYFHPENDPILQSVRDDTKNSFRSISDAAPSLVALDLMTNLASGLHKKYDVNDSAEISLRLQQVDKILAQAKAIVSVISDNNSALKAAQTSVRTAYLAVVKVYTDFQRRRSQGVVQEVAGGAFLIQDFRLGTDRKATITGVLSCVSDADAKPTTDQINFSILYQDVPRLTSSIGFLASSLEKKVIGTTSVAATNSAGFDTKFAVTDRAQAQVLPMIYANYRIFGYKPKHWPKREDELILTTSLSTGFGLNPNSGTTQPEFFTGLAFGFNRLLIHPGVHFGRTQNLAGGFALNSSVPAGFSGDAPISWSYHPAFSIGFSVRVAPY